MTPVLTSFLAILKAWVATQVQYTSRIPITTSGTLTRGWIIATSNKAKPTPRSFPTSLLKSWLTAELLSPKLSSCHSSPPPHPPPPVRVTPLLPFSPPLLFLPCPPLFPSTDLSCHCHLVLPGHLHGATYYLGYWWAQYAVVEKCSKLMRLD